ncbi:MAG: PepSY-associated TM helix domain-containing protein [Lautropia sp.]
MTAADLSPQGGPRRRLAWLHAWSGVMVGWLLYFVFVTGTVGYCAAAFDRWMRPELPLATGAAPATDAATAAAQALLQQRMPRAQSWIIELPGPGDAGPPLATAREPRRADGRPGASLRTAVPVAPESPALPAAARDPPAAALESSTAAAESSTAMPTARVTGGGARLYQMHYLLAYLPRDVAIRLVGAATLLMLILLVSGVVVHRKLFADFFTFRPGKGQRSWLDAHLLIGVATLPFLLVMSYSGLLFFMSTYMPAGIHAIYGPGPESRQTLFDELAPAAVAEASGRPAPLVDLAALVRSAERAWGGQRVAQVQVRHPGDAAAVVTIRARGEGGRSLNEPSLRYAGASGEALPPEPEGAASRIRKDLLAVHEGRFAGIALRALYLASGLLGCALIASGLVVWVRRRNGRGSRLIGRLNAGVLVGLWTALAAYLWANRLLPVDLAGRADAEVDALFATWTALLLHALLRGRGDPVRVWVEQFRIAALAFGLLPIVNAVTTDRHLGVTVQAGDWGLAGIDLAALLSAAVFAAMAAKASRSRSIESSGAATPARAAPDPARQALRGAAARSARARAASRVVAAGAGGYALTWLATAALAVGLVRLADGPRADGVYLATLLSFASYTAIVIAVFACRDAARAWAGIGFAAALLAGMLLASGLTA